jgi:hypothetical protein
VYNGCGVAVEKWTFHGVGMGLCPESELEDNDHIVAEWLISYEKSNHIIPGDRYESVVD